MAVVLLLVALRGCSSVRGPWVLGFSGAAAVSSSLGAGAGSVVAGVVGWGCAGASASCAGRGAFSGFASRAVGPWCCGGVALRFLGAGAACSGGSRVPGVAWGARGVGLPPAAAVVWWVAGIDRLGVGAAVRWAAWLWAAALASGLLWWAAVWGRRSLGGGFPSSCLPLPSVGAVCGSVGFSCGVPVGVVGVPSWWRALAFPAVPWFGPGRVVSGRVSVVWRAGLFRSVGCLSLVRGGAVVLFLSRCWVGRLVARRLLPGWRGGGSRACVLWPGSAGRGGWLRVLFLWPRWGWPLLGVFVGAVVFLFLRARGGRFRRGRLVRSSGLCFLWFVFWGGRGVSVVGVVVVAWGRLLAGGCGRRRVAGRFLFGGGSVGSFRAGGCSLVWGPGSLVLRFWGRGRLRAWASGPGGVLWGARRCGRGVAVRWVGVRGGAGVALFRSRCCARCFFFGRWPVALAAFCCLGSGGLLRWRVSGLA